MKQRFNIFSILILSFILLFFFKLWPNNSQKKTDTTLKIAILPFQNKSNKESLKFYSYAIADSLATSLQEYSDLKITRRQKILKSIYKKPDALNITPNTIFKKFTLNDLDLLIWGEFNQASPEKIRIKIQIFSLYYKASILSLTVQMNNNISFFKQIDSVAKSIYLKIKNNSNLKHQITQKIKQQKAKQKKILHKKAKQKLIAKQKKKKSFKQSTKKYSQAAKKSYSPWITNTNKIIKIVRKYSPNGSEKIKYIKKNKVLANQSNSYFENKITWVTYYYKNRIWKVEKYNSNSNKIKHKAKSIIIIRNNERQAVFLYKANNSPFHYKLKFKNNKVIHIQKFINENKFWLELKKVKP